MPYKRITIGYPSLLFTLVFIWIVGCDKPNIAHYTVAKNGPPLPKAAYESLENTSNQSADIQWNTPKDWQPGKPSSVRRASFLATGLPGQTLDISVTTFPGHIGSLLDNINRWRQQIDLGPITQDAVADFVQPLRIAGQEAILVDLFSDSQRTIVAILNRDEINWFFKLSGDRTLAEEHYLNFQAFLQSVQFVQNDTQISP